LKKQARLILIAGTARNVGKTTLVCRFIKEISAQKQVVALKFTTVKKGQENLHKLHEIPQTYFIYEEKNINSTKDTARMKKAGAIKSYWVVAQEDYVEEAIAMFFSKINSDTYIVAESAVLRKYINPRLFIIVDRKEAVNKKKYIQELRPLADYWIADIFLFKIEKIINILL